jgi:predicted GH43/DUF377 family glycosyl hydrolase
MKIKNNDNNSTQKIVHAKRIGPTINPDVTRVLMRPFLPVRKDIASRIIEYVMTLPEAGAAVLLEDVLGDFCGRHEKVESTLNKRYLQVKLKYMGKVKEPSDVKKALIGAYFTHEYSPEAAALFNPSIVAHPDQSNLPAGSTRFVLSLRAVGEGHISSITFRTGTMNAQHRITLSPHVPFTAEPEPAADTVFEKELFSRKLQEAGLHSNFCRRAAGKLPGEFSLSDLRRILDDERKKMSQVDVMADRAVQGILLLAESNFEVHFDPGTHISQRILFPSVPSQSNGIEDARFVKFLESGGSFTYYATYTAYDGKITLPQLLETKDFINFKFITLNGPAVQNKGMALFPRKINGQYAMLSRQDDENILLMYSDNLHFWQQPKLLLKPLEPWEMIKIGTCGSPIETEKGWLVLSHGVGAMRRYCLGAFLLDLEDPSKVIGRLKQPLLEPNEAEREGYVPNVVYTCGAIVHGSELIIPYAMSDYSSSFASVNLEELLGAMKL